ncbi:MAG: TraR/DksA family transcriptional regulator [Elusimicrobiota bacterium]
MTKSKASTQENKDVVVKNKPLAQSKLNAFKKVLLELRERIQRTMEQNRSKDLETTSSAEPGDDGDVAVQTYEKEILFEITGNERETLSNIDAALRRIANRSYGYCERCAKPIPLKRIKVLPYSRFCLTCQAVYESKRR